MIDKPLLYFVAKIVAAIASASIFNYAKVDITVMVISTLSFACVFLLEILLGRILKNETVIKMTVGISIIACFILGIEIFFPLFMILLVHLLDILIDSKMFYYILSIIVLLSFFIFMPNITSIVITFTLITMILFCRIILSRLKTYNQMNDAQKETLIELNKKLNDVKSLTKTLKYTASVEERNRIAARIHDQVGHGISGSIIMLEASMLIMKDNPEKATASIQKAITNLREGVDDIRTALRDERAERYLIGINDVTAMLEEFKVSYNKTTKLMTTGDLDVITLEIWACIHDNVKECLTNVLKHSNASEFLLNIEVFNKIIKVEYKDNGTSVENFEKGMGLEAIEERTVSTKGRCFFNKGEKGFVVTNIFIY
ncbi:MAG: sensor histidine kinase [Mobilitalea sp.]